MIGLLALAIAYVAAKKLDDLGDYKSPKGKYRNRYK